MIDAVVWNIHRKVIAVRFKGTGSWNERQRLLYGRRSHALEGAIAICFRPEAIQLHQYESRDDSH